MRTRDLYFDDIDVASVEVDGDEITGMKSQAELAALEQPLLTSGGPR
ncbi:MAG: hypothetical protein QNK42_08735 [Pseudodonghicola sp.]|nr:hypothetical protein [Pseudodonghicola sp.]